MLTDEEDDAIYQVVVNDEEQYSIWQEGMKMPLGWKAVGFSGEKEKCLDYIDKVWTDMRPLSLRNVMAENEKKNKAWLESLKGTSEN